MRTPHAFAILIGLLFLLAGCADTETRERRARCDNALTLVNAGFPRRALIIVGEKATKDEPTECAATRRTAKDRRGEAARTFTETPSLSPGRVTDVLRIDRESPEALAALYALAATTGPVPQDSNGCTTGGQLVDLAFPRQALVLLGNRGGCASQRSRALSAIGRATVLSQESVELQKSNPALVKVRAEQALALDRDNVTAQSSRDWMPPSTEETLAERTAAAWKSLTTTWLGPLGTVALPAAIILVGLLLLGRILTAAKWMWWLPGHGMLRGAVRAAALVLCIGTALAVPVFAEIDPFPTWWWLIPLGTALGGVALTAGWLASGLRLTVQAKDHAGADIPAVSTRTLAFVAELGGEAPRGTIIGRGADLTVLDGAGFETVATNKILTVLLSAARALVGFAPWSVQISQTSDTLWTSTILRNGRPMAEAVISGDQLRLTTKPEQGAPRAEIRYERLVAAHVITTMSDCYKRKGFEALDDVKSWRSLGLQYVAQTDLEEDDQRAERALSNALDAGGNRAAAYALEVRRYRSDPTDSLRFAGYLDRLVTALQRQATDPANADREQIDPRDPLTAQRQRVLYLRLAALINAHYQSPDKDPHAVGGLNDRIKQAAAEAYRAVEPDPSSSKNNVTEEIRPGVAALLFWARNHVGFEALPSKRQEAWESWIREDRGAMADYQLGCLFTDLGSKPAPEPFRSDPREPEEIAVSLLQRASLHSELAKWREKDPQLKTFLTTAAYRMAFHAPPSDDILSLPALDRCRPALEREKLTTLPSLLQGLETADNWWRNTIGLDREQLHRLRQTVGLVASVPEAETSLAPVRVELCRELAHRGELGLVDGSGPRNDDLAALITTAVERRFRWIGDLLAVGRWLEGLRPGSAGTTWKRARRDQ